LDPSERSAAARAARRTSPLDPAEGRRDASPLGIRGHRRESVCAQLRPAELNCGADDVQATLDSMLRERVIQVIADSMPPATRVAGRPSLRAGTRVSIHAPRLIEWDAVDGRLKCTAEVDVEAPRGFRAPAPTKRTEIRYRVMSSNPDTFLVEIAYADLMSAFTLQPLVTRDVVSTP